MKVTLGKIPSNHPKSIKFNVMDEFKINYRFPSKSFDSDKFIPFTKFDLTIEYYTKGNPEKFIAIMKGGEGVQNCIIDHKNNILKVIFENHNLNSGLLFAKYIFEFKDNDMVDMRASSIKIEATNIILENNIHQIE